MDVNKFFQSKAFKVICLGIAGLIILLLVFKVGEMVGFSKANFSCHWSDNYHKNFGGPRGGFPALPNDKDFLEANGTVGQVIKVATSSVVIKGRDDVEKVVSINASTTIKSLQKTIQVNNLKVDDMVVVIGEPNTQGQIEAKLIRVMPAPPIGIRFEVMPMRKW